MNKIKYVFGGLELILGVAVIGCSMTMSKSVNKELSSLYTPVGTTTVATSESALATPEVTSEIMTLSFDSGVPTFSGYAPVGSGDSVALIPIDSNVISKFDSKEPTLELNNSVWDVVSFAKPAKPGVFTIPTDDGYEVSVLCPLSETSYLLGKADVMEENLQDVQSTFENIAASVKLGSVTVQSSSGVQLDSVKLSGNAVELSVDGSQIILEPCTVSLYGTTLNTVASVGDWDILTSDQFKAISESGLNAYFVKSGEHVYQTLAPNVEVLAKVFGGADVEG